MYRNDPALLDEVERLRAENAELRYDPDYGILRRAGIERRYHQIDPHEPMSLIALDVDDMRGNNAKWGYDGTNHRIKASLACVRHGDIGRWYSGDEIVLIVPSSIVGVMVDRLTQSFAQHELSAMYGVATCTGDMSADVGRAFAQVQHQKKEAKRWTNRLRRWLFRPSIG